MDDKNTREYIPKEGDGIKDGILFTVLDTKTEAQIRFSRRAIAPKFGTSYASDVDAAIRDCVETWSNGTMNVSRCDTSRGYIDIAIAPHIDGHNREREKKVFDKIKDILNRARNGEEMIL